MADSTARLGALVPAAGRSVRMGQPKPLLPLGDTDFIGRLVQTLRQCEVTVDPVVVVRRDGDDSLRERLAQLAGPDLLTTTVPDDGGDMWRSLRVGAALLGPASGALVWPVDAPAVSVGTVSAVGRAALASPGRVVQPVVGEQTGHPSYVPREFFAGDDADSPEGLRGLLAAAPTPPIRVATQDPFSLLNVNTPAEYDALVRALRG